MIRIASAQGFWGDWPQAPVLQVRSGPIDFLVFDYLAEVTMSILQKQRRRDPTLGYATDFVEAIDELLPDLMEKGIRVIANAGGVNPHACAEAIRARAAKKLPGCDLMIGVVSGDDLLDRVGSIGLKALDPAAPEFEEIKDRIVSANAYFGVEPIVEALARGAQIVITGRVTDTSLTLAPIIHHFGVARTDYDAMATGIVAGHILECGAQASGGNFLGARLLPEQLVNVGFPIAEAHSPTEVVITKHESLGGLVCRATVSEQLLYEIGDPREYITPDVIADFTSIHLADDGPNRVRLTGVKGSPPPPNLKVSCAYADGYMLAATLVYTWPDASTKARMAGELLRQRAEAIGLRLDAFRVETIGEGACHQGLVGSPSRASEVVLRVAARSQHEKDLERLGREIVPLILTGPPGATGFAGGRPRPQEVLAYWPGLIPRSVAKPQVDLISTREVTTAPAGGSH